MKNSTRAIVGLCGVALVLGGVLAWSPPLALALAGIVCVGVARYGLRG